MNTLFHDCLGREIHVGDVIASGHRDGNSGSLAVGIVTGFTDSEILVTKLQRGKWYEYKDGSGKWWMQWDKGDTWRDIKGRCAYGERCLITGMSEADLRAIVAGQEEQGKQ